MYKELAKYYDYIYHKKDYATESKNIIALIERFKKSSGKELLDVACGTGKHLYYLRKKYVCTGIDLNKEMLAVAKRNVKGVKYYRGNMINFNLKKQFDIITCLFSSIGYAKTYANLDRTLKNFYKHLRTGGVLIIEPWIDRDKFYAGYSHVDTYEDNNIVIARVGTSVVKGNVSILKFSYLISKNDGRIYYYEDISELGFFDRKKMLEMMKRIGYDARFIRGKDKKDRGRYVAVKKATS
ncbi:MAG: class I SAM-dependent methyltransferase [Candidatus Woesearchaeota archaeon]